MRVCLNQDDRDFFECNAFFHLLGSHRAVPQMTDWGMLTDLQEDTGEIK